MLKKNSILHMNYGKSQQAIFLFTGNNKKAPFSFFIAVSRSLAKIDAQTPLYLPRCHLSYLSWRIGRYVATTTNGKVKLHFYIRRLTNQTRISCQTIGIQMIESKRKAFLCSTTMYDCTYVSRFDGH